MADYKLSLLEQETTFNFNRAEEQAEVFTYDPSLKRKLESIRADFPEDIILSNPDNGSGGATYLLPKKLITVMRPRKKKELSEEEKREIAERLRAGHSQR